MRIRNQVICVDCNVAMLRIGPMCVDHGGELYQCPTCKRIKIDGWTAREAGEQGGRRR